MVSLYKRRQVVAATARALMSNQEWNSPNVPDDTIVIDSLRARKRMHITLQ